jgi:hypothetical protein
MQDSGQFNLRTVWRRRAATALVLLSAFTRPIIAESSVQAVGNADANFQQALSEHIELNIREVIERFLPTRDFSVSAVAEVRSDAEVPTADLPYAVGSRRQPLNAGMRGKNLTKLSSKVAIEISLQKKYGSKTRNALKKIITRLFGLSDIRGDTFKFSVLQLEGGRDDIERQLEKAEADARAEKMRADTLAKDREDAAQKLILAESALEKERSDNANTKKTLWQEPITVWAAGGLALLAVLCVAGSFFFIGQRVGAAARAMAKSMESASTALAAAQQQNSEPNVKALQSASSLAIEAAEQKKYGDASSSSLPLEAVQTRVLALHEDLLAALNPTTEGILLKYLSELLESPLTAGKAVASMELLGKEKANAFFHRLGPGARDGILRFLRQGNYDRPKGEVMLEAGEELKTKLLGAAFEQLRSSSSPRIFELLLSLDDRDLANALATLTEEAVPRLLLYIEPRRIARVLAESKLLEAALYDRVLGQLSELASATTAEQFDLLIVDALEAQTKEAGEDIQRPFLAVYQEMIEAARDDIGEDIRRGLAQDTRLAEYLRQNVISLTTLFEVETSVLGEIITALSNRDVAAIVQGSSEGRRQLLMNALATRRRDLVAEEMERLQARGERAANAQFKKAKDIVVTKLRRMRAEGLLSMAPSDAGQANKEASNISGDADEQAA